MKLCAAQLLADIGNIESNVLKHEALIDVAVSRQADVVFFPELSLTGYVPRLAHRLATEVADLRLGVFQELADTKNIIIGVGLPTHAHGGVLVTMVLFRPHATPLSYSKQQLHADELPFFVQGDTQLSVSVGEHVLAPAICYESLQPNHAAGAARDGADVYLASVAKPQRNVTKAYDHYARMAKQHSMAVLMANLVGPCDDFVSAGQSGAWNRSGDLVANMDAESTGLVVFNTTTQEGSVVVV
jgi:predicted amidohydrolase